MRYTCFILLGLVDTTFLSVELLTAPKFEGTGMTVHGKIHQLHWTLCTDRQPTNTHTHTHTNTHTHTHTHHHTLTHTPTHTHTHTPSQIPHSHTPHTLDRHSLLLFSAPLSTIYSIYICVCVCVCVCVFEYSIQYLYMCVCLCVCVCEARFS